MITKQQALEALNMISGRLHDDWSGTPGDEDNQLCVNSIRAFIDSKTKWQPIETAPKDGSYILGAVEYHPSYVKGEYHIHQMSYNLGAWRIAGMRGQKAFVTHWMPLPAPPGEDE